MKTLRALCLVILLLPLSALPQTTSIGNIGRAWTGTGVNDNDLLFTTSGEGLDYAGCMLMSTDGAVEVEGTVDGTNWSTTTLSLQDLGATAVDPVKLTAADRMYYVPGRYRALRVRQNGATASAATLLCWTRDRQ